MPLNPSGHELESVGIDGTGLVTSKHFHINYSPLGASKIPAFTVAYAPTASTDTPAIRFLSEANHTGDTVSIERSEEGNFISFTYDGEEVLYAEEIGGLTAVSFISGGAIKGSVSALSALDIDAENILLATKTISADSEFTASSHRDYQLLYLLITNSDSSDHTITFGSGFSASSVTATASSTTLLSFVNNGTNFIMVAGGSSGGGLPAGTENQTVRYNSGDSLEATDNLLNDGVWEVWNGGSVHGGSKTITDLPFDVTNDLIEYELSCDTVITVNDIGNRAGHYVVFKFTEDGVGGWKVNFSDDFIHNGERSFNAYETFTIAFIFDGFKWNEVPTFKVEDVEYDKLVVYDTNRLILYNTNRQEIKRINSQSTDEYVEYFPRFSVYDNDNSVFYSITTDSKLIKHDTADVSWVVSNFNILDVGSDNVIYGIKLGSDGYIYVITRVRIYVFDSDGVAITNFGGYGLGTNGKFANIKDFQEYDGDLYILDYGYYSGGVYSGQLQKLQNDGTFTWRKTTISSARFYELAHSSGICLALDSDYIFVCGYDDANGYMAKCYVLDHDGVAIYPNIHWDISGSGEDYLNPQKCLINENGDLVISHIWKLNSSGTKSEATNEISIWEIDGTFVAKQSLTSTRPSNYFSLCIDTANNYWFTDYYQKKIESYWLNSTTFELSNTYYSFSYSTGVTLDYDLSSICGVAVVENKIFVANSTEEEVYIFDSMLNYLDKFSVSGIDAICEDRLNGRVVCSCDDHVEVYDTSGNLIFQFDGGSGDGDMLDNWYIACSPVTAKFYLTQYGSDYCFIYDTDGTYLDRFGGTGTDNGEFTTPYGVDVDDDGFVYVVDGTDGGDGRVQKFEDDGTYILTFAGLDLEYAMDVVCGQNGYNYVIGSGTGASGFVPYFDSEGTYIGYLAHATEGYGYSYLWSPTYGAYLKQTAEVVEIPPLAETHIYVGNASNEPEDSSKITVSSDITITLGDSAGSNKLIIKDSGGNTVATIDSDGHIVGIAMKTTSKGSETLVDNPMDGTDLFVNVKFYEDGAAEATTGIDGTLHIWHEAF